MKHVWFGVCYSQITWWKTEVSRRTKWEKRILVHDSLVVPNSFVFVFMYLVLESNIPPVWLLPTNFEFHHGTSRDHE